MKPVAIAAIAIILFGAGAGGAWWFVSQRGAASGGAGGSNEHAGHDHGPAGEEAEGSHGTPIEIPADASLCEKHRIPQVVCPFCDPSLIQSRGHCGEHDVAEALCTRCSPILIAAFKAEKDWCAEHELPESQCLICNPKTGG